MAIITDMREKRRKDVETPRLNKEKRNLLIKQSREIDSYNPVRLRYLKEWARAHKYSAGRHFKDEYGTGELSRPSVIDRTIVGEEGRQKIGIVVEEPLRTRRTFVGKLYESIRRPECVALNERDEGGVTAARRATTLLDYHYYRLRLEHIYQTILGHAAIYGTGIAKIFWDRDADPWDITVEAVSPLEFRVNTAARDEKSILECSHSWAEPLELLRERFSDVKGIDEASSENLTDMALLRTGKPPTSHPIESPGFQ